MIIAGYSLEELAARNICSPAIRDLISCGWKPEIDGVNVIDLRNAIWNLVDDLSFPYCGKQYSVKLP